MSSGLRRLRYFGVGAVSLTDWAIVDSEVGEVREGQRWNTAGDAEQVSQIVRKVSELRRVREEGG